MATLSIALLRYAHDNPGVTRAEAARAVGIGTGTAAELVSKLTAADLLAERPSGPSGHRGRPTTVLVASPSGPVVLAASITHESWTLAAFELGGTVVAECCEEHNGRDGRAVLAEIGAAARRLRRRLGPERVRGIGVAVPGTVTDGVLRHASNLGWRDLDLRAVWPRTVLLMADNDATCAAAAESRRGSAMHAGLALHVRIQAGLGGALVDDGRVLRGGHGLSGEFGHMPFGDPSVECPCGARGCWGTAVDASAMARLLQRRPPRDMIGYAHRVLARARAGEPDERRAVAMVGAALGRGLAGLVNGLDPDVITLGGLGVDLLAIASDSVVEAYRAGLMRFRGAEPPPVVPATLGERGVLAGAAEQVWAALLPTL